MDRIDSTLGTTPPLLTPRSPRYNQERRNHDENERPSDGDSGSNEDQANSQTEAHEREDETKGSHIDIQI